MPDSPTTPLTAFTRPLTRTGYEEELHDQAADLLEFGDEDADAGLDGLPRFDGEFSPLRHCSPGAKVPVTFLDEATSRAGLIVVNHWEICNG